MMRRAFLMLAMLTAMAASAQELQLQPSEGIPLGPFIFSPDLELSWEVRDNIFFSPDNEVDDSVYLARLRLMFEVPVLDSYVRLTYTPQWREYGEYKLSKNWSHFVDLGGVFTFASGLKLVASYRYVDANMETGEIDPGGELVFGDVPFEKHRFKLTADYWISPRDGVTLEGKAESVDVSGRQLFYDYSRTAYAVGWLHQLSPTLVMNVKWEQENFDADDKEAGDWRDSDSNAFLVGFRGSVTPVLTSALELGWKWTDVGSPEGVKLDDFSGVVAKGSLLWKLGESSELALSVLRMDYPSNCGNNAYYTATGAGLKYSLRRHRLFGHLSFHYQNNDYKLGLAEGSPSRSDDITTVSAGLGYRFTDLLSLRGSFRHEERDSLHEFSYDASFFLLGLVLGF